MKRGLLFLGIVIAFSFSWVMSRRIPLAVIGQPTAAGLMQGAMEEPFFAGLAEASGLPLKVAYRPLDETGIMDSHQLQMLKDGLFDLVSLRFPENSIAEPSLQGIDMVGLHADYASARRAVYSYATTVDRYLNESFEAKLLGVWPFGPQVFFCRVPIQGIEDIAGLRVRISSSSMATVIAGLGGIPVTIGFIDTKNALASGMVDCAVTSSASANFAGWPEHVGYYFPLSVHFGLNGYAISLRTWNMLSSSQQRILQETFDAYLDELWRFSQTIHEDASNCNVGRDCQSGNLYHLGLVQPSERDEQLLRETSQALLLPEWAERCEGVHPGCRQEWEDTFLSQAPIRRPEQ
ncbi:MAG: ABC transporter substrate-binding protein [Spirochaetaceae bacterium]|nr:MAG: ABC transporter substrate-binding protein [Spirochaetaceae bacterium]